ncbi:MAG TPA: hypothetical protein PLV42_03750 [bacterium]|nr:hypothetical protein [bacterium]
MKLCRCDIVRILSALFFLLLFFGWGTAGKFWIPFELYFPTFHLLFLGITAVALLSPVRAAAAALWAAIVPRRYLLFPLFALIATLLINLLVFQGIPHIQDSINYLFMAGNFASGQLDHQMVPYYEFFRFLYLIPDGEKIYSLFLPGYSFFLVPFVMFGIPFIANPLITAANITLVGRIADDLFGPRVSTVAMALAILSVFIMVMGGTFMAHPFCALMTLATVHFFLRSRTEPVKRRALIFAAVAGFLLGWLLFTRPQNALFLALPLALTALVEIRRDGTVPRGLALLAAFLPWLLALFIYNAHYTGDPLLFKQDPYFNYSEPNEFCHRFGIGRGCPNSNWTVLPEEGLTWPHAAHITYRRLSPLILNTFGHPLFFLFISCAFLFHRAGRPKRELFLAMLFLATVAGYFFFYFDGNVFGPRYYYETTFFLIILAALGLTALAERIAALPLARLYTAALGGAITAAYLCTAIFVLPPLFATYALGFWKVERSLSDEIARRDIHNAVVFVDHPELIGSGLAVMRHDNWDKNDVIYVRDLGVRSNSALMHYYQAKGRSFYQARYALIQGNDTLPVITPVTHSELPPGYIVVEMEDKFYPLRGVPDYCNTYPNRSDLSKYVSLPPPEKLKISFSKMAFFCRFHDPDEYYTFGQNFLVAGHYTIEFVGVTGPEMGRFRLFIDERPVGVIDFTGERYEKVIRQVTAFLSAGFHFLRLEPDDMTRDTYFLLDFVEFFAQNP